MNQKLKSTHDNKFISYMDFFLLNIIPPDRLNSSICLNNLCFMNFHHIFSAEIIKNDNYLILSRVEQKSHTGKYQQLVVTNISAPSLSVIFLLPLFYFYFKLASTNHPFFLVSMQSLSPGQGSGLSGSYNMLVVNYYVIIFLHLPHFESYWFLAPLLLTAMSSCNRRNKPS